MENINKYGVLSDKELLEFLAEIQDENEEAQDEEAQDEEAQDEEAQDEEAQDEETKIKKGNQPSEYFTQYARQRRAKIVEINRMAFSQSKLDLNSVINASNIRLLLDLTVKKDTEKIELYAAFINKRLTKLLKPFIPRALMQCWLTYPHAFYQYPGFLYEASKEYGDGLSFWATPNIPYYIKQGTERTLIEKSNPNLLYAVDEVVKRYHKRLESRADKELKNATELIIKCVRTYLDLLKARPLWFELLYKEIIKD